MSTEYEYSVIKETTLDKLTNTLNRAAATGWEPINAYSCGMNNNQHAALLRRPKATA